MTTPGAFLIGSGCSIEYGMPSVSELTEYIRGGIRRVNLPGKLPNFPGGDRLRTTPKGWFAGSTISEELHNLITENSPEYRTEDVDEIVRIFEKMEGVNLTKDYEEILEQLVGYEVQSKTSNNHDYDLIPWVRGAILDLAEKRLNGYIRFGQAGKGAYGILKGIKPAIIATTNQDTLIEQIFQGDNISIAVPEGVDSHPCYCASDNLPKIELYKIHGSVDWGTKIPEYPDCVTHAHWAGTNKDKRYGGFQIQISKRLESVSKIVVSGYGFRDDGVNKLLKGKTLLVLERNCATNCRLRKEFPQAEIWNKWLKDTTCEELQAWFGCTRSC